MSSSPNGPPPVDVYSNRHADGLEGRPFDSALTFSAAVTSFSAAACVTSKGVPIGKARLAEIAWIQYWEGIQSELTLAE